MSLSNTPERLGILTLPEPICFKPNAGCREEVSQTTVSTKAHPHPDSISSKGILYLLYTPVKGWEGAQSDLPLEALVSEGLLLLFFRPLGSPLFFNPTLPDVFADLRE